MSRAERLDREIRSAGIAIAGVSPDAAAPGGYRVTPSSLQAAAQSIIDNFNPDDPAHDAAELSASALSTSRQKDVLATCALIVRARGINAWNNMTVQQKVGVTLAEADVWKNIREFIDDKA